MKRDLELIRLILLRVEEAEYGTVHAKLFVEYEERVVAEHFQLLEEAGLIDASIATYEKHGALHGTALRLTWSGHEFLEAARNETIWRRSLTGLRSSGVGITFDLLKAVLRAKASETFGIELGG